MLNVPNWLPDFVRERMAATMRDRPESAEWIREAGGISLFGTIGAEAYLRPDGSVWYYQAVDWVKDPEKYEWREGRGNDRWMALVLGTKRIPELRQLLPKRPPDAPNCPRCGGSGEVFVTPQDDGTHRGISCPECGRLGWIAHGAA